MCLGGHWHKKDLFEQILSLYRTLKAEAWGATMAMTMRTTNPSTSWKPCQSQNSNRISSGINICWTGPMYPFRSVGLKWCTFHVPYVPYVLTMTSLWQSPISPFWIFYREVEIFLEQDKINYAVSEREDRVTDLTTLTRIKGCTGMYWAATGLQTGCTEL